MVLVILGEPGSAGIGAALARAGASVRVVSTMADARRSIVASGPGGTVVLDPWATATTTSMHADFHALGRRGSVVVLSTHATTEERIDMLGMGADSVLASADPDEVVATLAAIHRRSATPAARTGSEVVRAGDICLDRVGRTATRDGRELALTPLEFDLLSYLVAHAGHALSRDQLLESVWGYEIGGRDTVTVHVRRLRCKVEDDPSRPTLIQTVWGTGYRWTRIPPTRPPARRAEPQMISNCNGPGESEGFAFGDADVRVVQEPSTVASGMTRQSQESVRLFDAAPTLVWSPPQEARTRPFKVQAVRVCTHVQRSATKWRM